MYDITDLPVVTDDGVDIIDSFIKSVTKYEKEHEQRLHIDDIREVFRAKYETDFGIYNHGSHGGKRPLASIAFHPLENINQGSLLESYMDLYLNCDIRNIWGESFEEFMNAPLDVVEMKAEKAKNILNRKAREQEEAERKNKLILPNNIKL